MEKMDFAFYKKSADFVKKIIKCEPDIAIILGSCLGDFAARIKNPVIIDYRDIPNFLVSTVQSHAGKLIFGTVGNKKVICMSGRFHRYEGYSFEQLTIPIRLFKLLGVKATIITNAAGAVNENYNVGDVMVISDHLKLTCDSPLGGTNIEEFGPRFFDTTDMYTSALRTVALNCAKKSALKVHEGTYMYFTGPQFETPAEIRAARILGADAIGMSTVTEALTAAHCSMPLLGLSVMTNMAAGILEGKISHEEVNVVGDMISTSFGDFVENIISSIQEDLL